MAAVTRSKLLTYSDIEFPLAEGFSFQAFKPPQGFRPDSRFQLFSSPKITCCIDNNISCEKCEIIASDDIIIPEYLSFLFPP